MRDVDVMTVSTTQAANFMPRLLRHVRRGGQVRILNLNTCEVVCWMLPPEAQPADPGDLDIIRARQQTYREKAIA